MLLYGFHENLWIVEKSIVIVQLQRQAQPVMIFFRVSYDFMDRRILLRTRFGHCVLILLSKYNIFDGINDIKNELPAATLV